MISRGVAGDSPRLAPGVYWTRSIAGMPVNRAGPARATEATLIRLELNKSIEARKLNKRTGSPTTDPEVVIPYGAFVENVEADRDFERFTYLGELYQCTHTLRASATDPRAWKAQLAPAAEPATPAASSAGQSAPAAPRLQWEPLDRSEEQTSELQTPMYL